MHNLTKTKPFRMWACSLALLLSGGTLLAQDPGKNVYSATFRTLPRDLKTFPEETPGEWDFNFRPYGKTDMLWTDPILQRNVTSGSSDKAATALHVSCDEKGFTVLVLSSEPQLKDSFANTNNYPSPTLEFFFAPGDADTPEITHYYQMMFDGVTLREFPWLVAGSDFRPCLPHTEAEEIRLKSAVLARISVRWDPLFDRLPIFPAKKDNFWRLSMIRWGAISQTWGGTVHQANLAGYIRWPEFTEEQKTAIMKNILVNAWISFNKDIGDVSYTVKTGWSGVNPMKAHFRDEENALDPRSYSNFNEDPAFRPVLDEMVLRRKALAPKIGIFDNLPYREKVAFYKEASNLLLNFKYDVQKAYASLEKSRTEKAIGNLKGASK